MAEELGTKDVLGQLDARLGNVETDVRDLRAEMRSGFDRVQQSFNDFNIRFEPPPKKPNRHKWRTSVDVSHCFFVSQHGQFA